MLLEHTHSLHRLAQFRSEDALRAADNHRRAREAQAFAKAPMRRPWRGLRLRRSTPLPCVEPAVRGSWQVAFGPRERCV